MTADPEIDFRAMMARYDTFLVGRKTFVSMQKMGGGPPAPGIRTFVCSRTLEHVPASATLTADAAQTVRDLKAAEGRDIAVFGGGELFRSLLAERVVDRVEVSLVPVLLGGGIPFLPSPADRAKLRLVGHRVYATTGTVSLQYELAG